jgi:membrane protease YdiL (CAAX protease family)
MTLALFVIVHPIAEELLFRGYVQTRLRERWGPLAGIAITSLVFGFYHLPDQALFGVIFGAYLGWVAQFSGGTRPAILAHIANNLIAAVALFRVPHAMADIPQSVTGVAIAASEASEKVVQTLQPPSIPWLAHPRDGRPS